MRSDPNASMTGATERSQVSIWIPCSPKVLVLLTIHIDATLPFLQLLRIICLDGTAGERRLGRGRIPIRWEKLDINLRNERQGSNLGLKIQVGRMCHKPNNRNVENMWRRQNVG
jgi:hypothetical protein